MSPILYKVALLFKSILANTECAARVEKATNDLAVADEKPAMSEQGKLVAFSISRKGTCSEAGVNPFPAEGDVHAQLQRILTSRFFSNSERLRRFISFAANHALSGNTQRLKERLVGLEVFDRRSSYDPRIDPIVRVEARRLRSKLKLYYASVGRGDQLLIEFPKGTYTPVFRFRTPKRNKLGPTTGTAIAVSPFANLSNSAIDECFSNGLTDEVIHQLTRVPSLQVVVCQPGLQMHRHDGSPRCGSDVTKWNTMLRGSIRREHGTIRVIVQLIDTTSGAYVWSETYDRAIENVLSIQEGIAQAVVAKLELTLELLQRAKAS
jgi:TolB-like protein